MFSQQQQQQQQQPPPASPGPLTINHLGQQQSQPQQQFSWGQAQQQPGTPQPSSTWSQAQAPQSWSSSSPHQQSLSPTQSMDAQYIPGYLNKLKGGVRPGPYSSPSKTNEPHSPPSYDSASPMRGNVGRSDTVVSFAESSSPNRGFASSFFLQTAAAAAAQSDHVQQQRESSIFGAGGLRNSRRSATAQFQQPPSQQQQPDFSPAANVRRRSGGILRNSSGFSSPTQMDDDDAPPVEGLHDESIGYTAGVTQVAAQPPVTTAAARQSVAALFERSSEANDNRNAASDAADLASRTVLVYGFAPGAAQAVAQHFKHIGETLSCKHEGEAGQALRIVYAESWMALRAMSRTGELLPLAGGCYVGVRFADEDAHRHVTLHGLDATNPSVQEQRHVMTPEASSRPASISAAGMTANAPTTTVVRANTPLIGRPISLIGESTSSILLKQRPTPAKPSVSSTRHDTGDAPHGSPFRLRGAGLLSGANTPAANSTPSKPANSAAPTPSTGVMGRLGDAIFGW